LIFLASKQNYNSQKLHAVVFLVISGKTVGHKVMKNVKPIKIS